MYKECPKCKELLVPMVELSYLYVCQMCTAEALAVLTCYNCHYKFGICKDHIDRDLVNIFNLQ